MRKTISGEMEKSIIEKITNRHFNVLMYIGLPQQYKTLNVMVAFYERHCNAFSNHERLLLALIYDFSFIKEEGEYIGDIINPKFEQYSKLKNYVDEIHRQTPLTNLLSELKEFKGTDFYYKVMSILIIKTPLDIFLKVDDFKSLTVMFDKNNFKRGEDGNLNYTKEGELICGTVIQFFIIVLTNLIKYNTYKKCLPVFQWDLLKAVIADYMITEDEIPDLTEGVYTVNDFVSLFESTEGFEEITKFYHSCFTKFIKGILNSDPASLTDSSRYELADNILKLVNEGFISDEDFNTFIHKGFLMNDNICYKNYSKQLLKLDKRSWEILSDF